jgi:hypothetical protein
MTAANSNIDSSTHRQFAVSCFNACWDLMRKEDRTPEENRVMVSLAYASRWHWTQVENRRPVNFSRSEWQLARALVLEGHGEAALDHARNGLEWIEQHPEIGPFDRAFAHESIARAQVALERSELARAHLKAARDLAPSIESQEDRDWLLSNLETIHLD